MTKNSTSRTQEDILGAEAIVKQHQQDVPHGQEPSLIELTADDRGEMISYAIEMLGRATYSAQNRVVADNGKSYLPEADLPRGVEDTGEVVTVNAMAYVQRQLCSTLVWKLESMIENCDENIVTTRKLARKELGLIQVGKGDQRIFDGKVRFLNTLLEQRATLEIYFAKACDAYFVTVGEEYETKAMKARSEAVMTRTTTLDAATARALGV